jgi:hypothetical protein
MVREWAAWHGVFQFLWGGEVVTSGYFHRKAVLSGFWGGFSGAMQGHDPNVEQLRRMYPCLCTACRIQCPHCGRRFAELVAERHIPKCSDIIAKPSRLKAAGGHSVTMVAGTLLWLPPGYRRLVAYLWHTCHATAPGELSAHSAVSSRVMAGMIAAGATCNKRKP